MVKASLVRAVLGAVILAATCAAAERHWQTGTWVDTSVKRQFVDFGPGASGFGRPSAATPAMRAMADVRTFVIETVDQRLELQDVVQVGRRSIEATVGEAVTFALEKNTVYIRGANGMEHRLRVTKKSPRAGREK
jgi:hypothetical protein